MLSFPHNNWYDKIKILFIKQNNETIMGLVANFNRKQDSWYKNPSY